MRNIILPRVSPRVYKLKINISNDLQLPLETVTQTLVVYGGKGMGKTSFVTVLMEELSRCKQRFAAIDPMGVMWGLRHSKDGKDKGIEVLILGGKHGDIPIEASGGRIVADLVADENVNVIIDISTHPNGKTWARGERIGFVADYCTRLYERQGESRRPIMQIIDEAGRYCPQTIPHGSVDLARCTGAVETIVEEGRNYGIGVCLVTQRSARMNKSVSELADCMIAFRTVGPNSVNAILDWFGEHVEKTHWKQLIEQLRSLPRGTAEIVSPGWLGFEGKVAIRERDTFDSSSTPKAGKEHKTSGEGAKLNLKHYVERMKETIERSIANDPKRLHKQLNEAQSQILQLQKELSKRQVAAPVQPKEVINPNAIRDAVAARDEEWLNAVQIFKANCTATLEKLVFPVPKTNTRKMPRPKTESSAVIPSKPVLNSVLARPQLVQKPIQTNGDLTGPEQRILNAIAWMESIGVTAPKQTAVAFLAGYTVGGGGFNNPRGALRVKGLLEYRGDTLVLTDAGRNRAETPDVPLSVDELHNRVLQQLPGPEQKILINLIAAYPNALPDEELAIQSGYTPGGGGYNNPRGRLRTLGLADYPERGMVKAADLLFI